MANTGKLTSKEIDLSSIERSVTHLLVATKQLLETLTAWSRGLASEDEVSDIYVRLGSEFNNACRSFISIGVETGDLGNVPDELRSILESTLSQPATPASLEVFLPKIREIIINLLHGLKRKQSKLRAKQDKDVNPEAVKSSDKSNSISESYNKAKSLETLESTIEPALVKASTGEKSSRTAFGRLQDGVPRPDAFRALERENALERRASRRYSAYQTIAKLAQTTQPTLNKLDAAAMDNSTRSREDRGRLYHDQKKHEDSIDMPASTSFQLVVPEYVGETKGPGPVTVFLQQAGRTRKVELDIRTDGIGRENLLQIFKRKFDVAPSAEDAIYIKAPDCDVFYELEEFTDIKHNCILRCGPDQDISLRTRIQSELLILLNQTKFPTGQLPTSALVPIEPTTEIHFLVRQFSSSLQQVLNMKRELAGISRDVLSTRQQLFAQLKELKHNIRANTRSKFLQFPFLGDRVALELGKIDLSKEVDVLVSRVDDIQDSVELLRKDVLKRGIRVQQDDLLSVRSQLNHSSIVLQNLQRYVINEKQHWKRVWERELESVCEDQQFCSIQEELLADMRDDLHKALQTFILVEECSNELGKKQLRSPGQKMILDAFENPVKETLLEQIRSLNPDHLSRLSAVEELESSKAQTKRALLFQSD